MNNKPAEPAQSGGSIAFGPWRLDVDRDSLSDGKTVVHLQPQIARLLAYFLSNQDRIITRDELILHVWGHRLVSDDAINRCISILRKILHADDRHAYIETVARKGYLAHFPAAPDQSGGQAKRRYHATVLISGGLGLLLLGWMVFDRSPAVTWQTDPAGALPVVAVLPFAATEPSTASAHLAEGIHNDLLTHLAQLPSIRVISGTSVQGYREVLPGIREIGKQLGADAIVEGSVQVSGPRLRINAQLIDARTDHHLWADSYERLLSPGDLLAAQSQIAAAITDALNVAMTHPEDPRPAQPITRNLEAYRAFQRAMTLQDRNLPEVLELLETAVALDPLFTRAWAELTINYAYRNFAGGGPQFTALAEEALRQLAAIAPDSADHLIAEAGYLYYSLKDPDRALDIISQAVAQRPSDTGALQLKSWIERRRGDFDAYLRTLQEIRVLDPRNPSWTARVLMGLMLTHRYDEAWAELQASTLDSVQSDLVRHLLSFRSDRNLDRLKESVAASCRLGDLPDCGWLAFVAGRDYPGALAALSGTTIPDTESLTSTDRRRLLTYWVMGDQERLASELAHWDRLLQSKAAGYRHPPGTDLDMALIAGLQGEHAKAQQWIERWYRRQPIDWAERAHLRDETCRILGMVGAPDAAIQCIRDGLEEPSNVMPFLEPYLPFYDGIRDLAQFHDDVLAEIGQ